jgi:tetratricopeptide (TPR) repeat protein
LIFYGRGDNAEAIKYFDKAFELNPQLAQAYVHRGQSHKLQKNLKQALTDLIKAIEIDPKLFDAYIERANIYDLMGEKMKAAEDRAVAAKKQ